MTQSLAIGCSEHATVRPQTSPKESPRRREAPGAVVDQDQTKPFDIGRSPLACQRGQGSSFWGVSKKQHRPETLGSPLRHLLVSARSGSLPSHFGHGRGPWLSSEERVLQGGCCSRPFYVPLVVSSCCPAWLLPSKPKARLGSRAFRFCWT